ncbi:MAG: geranylgeranyl reductase family protein [Candidatus Thermoplasmatota archaeon]|nr:geranylgeranyl reductase family protein [Candidatus Thermoplasmatota archaeon]MEC8997291.1 geranylgeranyl reductase family protein [Candidatus Thermoplasmatota archaeon]MEC9333141.1 geranylgeranyl reductase family protein [Candidatus Thermoplasmatota archaeon]MED6305357.1 geranylgeranyl reductase family protein [Candidatus Thermoplasmatota archaeon]MEE3242716.1 geranylgeranyl reductase family protein [Candidatus Thermoplasmatota archaeon]
METEDQKFWEKGIESGPVPKDETAFDVIVVGGGPAGSAAACYAALDGNKVLLVEKSSYPKDKTCGDAVGGKSLGHVEELGVGDTLKSTPHFKFDSVLFSSPSGDEFKVELPDERVAGYVFPRIQFDWILFDRASELVRKNRGSVIQNFAVKEMVYENVDGGGDPGTKSGDKRKVIGIRGKYGGKKLEFRAPLTIGAGGVYCPVADSLIRETYDEDLIDKSKKHYSAAFRQYWKGVEGVEDEMGSIEFHYVEGVLPGYFWIFPIGNGISNVGFGMALADIYKQDKKLRGLQEFVINGRFAERFKDAKLVDGSSKGWQLPLGSPRKIPTKPRRAFGNGCVLIGDSASLVDPFTGEGIGNALLSAKLAIGFFDKIVDRNGFPLEKGKKYQKKLWNVLGKELTNSFKLQKYTRKKWLVNWFVRKAKKKPELRRLLTESLTSREAQAKLTSPWLLFRNLVF